MTAYDIIRRVGMELNDEKHYRWTTSMLADFITDAMRITVLNRPDASAVIRTIKLQRGTYRQELPPDILYLLKVVRNKGANGKENGRPITPTTREAMDACMHLYPDIEYDTVDQYAYIHQTPNTFWIYPLPTENVYIEIEGARNIIQLSNQITSEPYLSLQLSDIWMEPIREYVLYRCYSINAASQIDNERARQHLQYYYSSIGNEKMARYLSNPYNRSYNLVAENQLQGTAQ